MALPLMGVELIEHPWADIDTGQAWFEPVDAHGWVPLTDIRACYFADMDHPEAGEYWSELALWQYATAVHDNTASLEQHHHAAEATKAKERKRKRNNHKRNKKERKCLDHLANQPLEPDAIQDVHVLTSQPLPDGVREGLALGMSFVPTQPAYRCAAPEDVRDSVLDLGRTLAWQLFFRRRQPTGATKDRPKPRFWVKTNTPGPYISMGPVGKILQEHIQTCALDMQTATGLHAAADKHESNLSIATRKILHNLGKSEEFVVKLADKNMGVCILDKPHYHGMVMTFLGAPRDFYKCDKTPAELITAWTTKTEAFIKTIKPRLTVFTADARDLQKFLCTPREYEVPHFYTLVKVHKNPPAGRPITACVKAPTTWLAKMAAGYLHDLMIAMFPQVLKDSKDFVASLSAVTVQEHLRSSVWLVTLDVVGLYTNIPIPTAVGNIRKALMSYLDTRQLEIDHEALAVARIGVLMNIIEHVFTHMWVQYEGDGYQQIHGFPMGSSLSPDAANVYMAFMEDLQGLYNCKGHPLADTLPDTGLLLLCKRFIDDYAVILVGLSRTQLQTFLGTLRDRVAPLELTETVSQDEMTYLDTTVYKAEDFAHTGKFSTRTYSKPGNCYAYVHRTSNHVPPTFKGVIRGELVRYAVTCSTIQEFVLQTDRLKDRLLRRGYELKLIEREITDMQQKYELTRAAQLSRAGFQVQNPPYWLAPEAAPHIAEPAPPATPTGQMQPCVPITVFLKLRYDNVTSCLRAKRRLYKMKAELLAELQQKGHQNNRLTRELEQMQLTVCHTRGPSLGAMLVKASTAPRVHADVQA